MTTILATIGVVALCMALFAIPIFVFNRKDLQAGKCSTLPGSDKLSCGCNDDEPVKAKC